MLLALLTTTILLAPAPARVPAGGGEGKARVMILGVYHFDNPGLDYVKTEAVDHLSEAKQAEIAEVLDRLGAFEPTKIVVAELLDLARPELARSSPDMQLVEPNDYLRR